MPVKSPFTIEEEKKILLVAESLIKQPESWVKGKWKCPAKERGSNKQATNENGVPLYQYCIDGAVSQAIVDVVGLERLSRMGGTMDGDGRVIINGMAPTAILGLDAISTKLHGVPAISFNDQSATKHEDILKLLKSGLKSVATRLKRSRTPKAA